MNYMYPANNTTMYPSHQRCPQPGVELARAYVPFQQYTTTFPIKEALLKRGTLFPELYKPYKKKGCY
jgi:hypothetical protein